MVIAQQTELCKLHLWYYNLLYLFKSTNRTVLKWLKLWDKVVFNKEKKATKPSATDKKKKEKKEQNANKFSQYELTEELDQHGRPLHRVRSQCVKSTQIRILLDVTTVAPQ